jgi:hypothetical protein
MAHVVVRVGQNQMESVITRRRTDQLGLKKGDKVAVIIKSTEAGFVKRYARTWWSKYTGDSRLALGRRNLPRSPPLSLEVDIIWLRFVREGRTSRLDMTVLSLYSTGIWPSGISWAAHVAICWEPAFANTAAIEAFTYSPSADCAQKFRGSDIPPF